MKCNTIRYDTIQYDAIQYDRIQYNTNLKKELQTKVKHSVYLNAIIEKTIHDTDSAGEWHNTETERQVNIKKARDKVPD